MGSFFHYASFFHHIYLLGLHNICEPVRNQKDGLRLCKTVDHFHDLFLTLRINVGCGFVKYINRRIV